MGRFRSFVNSYRAFRERRAAEKKQHLAEKSKELDDILKDWPKRDLYSLWQNANRRSWLCAYVGGFWLALSRLPDLLWDASTILDSIFAYGELIVFGLIFSVPIFILTYMFCYLTADVYHSFKLNLAFVFILPVFLLIMLNRHGTY